MNQTSGCDCGQEFHAPECVKAKGAHCARYNEWLKYQAESCRRRDEGLLAKRPPLSEYRQRIHAAVVRSKGLDEYTGEALEWNRINHERPTAGGRKNHRKRGLWPSVDHYHGPGKLSYRICSGIVNHAKGALDHQQFVALCRKVAGHHQGWGKTD